MLEEWVVGLLAIPDLAAVPLTFIFWFLEREFILERQKGLEEWVVGLLVSPDLASCPFNVKFWFSVREFILERQKGLEEWVVGLLAIPDLAAVPLTLYFDFQKGSLFWSGRRVWRSGLLACWPALTWPPASWSGGSSTPPTIPPTSRVCTMQVANEKPHFYSTVRIA